jgi:uncharacterized protein YegP (UPF0339 family)
MKIEIFRDSKKEHRLRFVSGNGNKLVVSEGYKRRAGAMNAFKAIRKAFESKTWQWK